MLPYTAQNNFANMIKLKILRERDTIGLFRRAWNTTRILIKEAEGDLTHRRREGIVTTEAEMGVIQPQAKQYQQPLESTRDKEQILPWSLWREGGPVDTLVLTLISNF